MTEKGENDFRAVPTTVLTIDREAIDWERLRQSCHIVRYEMPFYNRKKDKHYFSRMHNWYKQESDYPCYLHTHGPHLYVKYDNPDQVVDLSYEGQPLHYTAVNLQDEAMLPGIIKLLVADFFQADGRFVSNAKFFLWATADKDFITGLEIELKHNYKENKDEFIISDKASRLRKLRSFEFDKIQSWRQVYYGRFYPAPDMPVFKQLKRDQLTRAQLNEGIYELFPGSRTNRASLTFHSTKSLSALRQTRSFLLNQFIERFIAHLNDLGLPFQQKRLQMQAVHSTPIRMTERQLPPEKQPIYIVDDRLNATRKPDDFAVRFCEMANTVTPDHNALFKVKAEAELQSGDWALRIQDYNGDEFDPEEGILKAWQDGKSEFYTRHPDVVKQSLTVNENSQKQQKSATRKKPRKWTADEYLDYPVPSTKDKGLQMELEVCRNQLHLKDAVMHPQEALSRFPQAKMMDDALFLYKQALVYLDGSGLHFMSIANNLEEASAFIQSRTGWDLLTDILIPSAERYYFDYTERSTAMEDTTKRPFIISRDFVWEIWEENGRVLNEDMVVQQRLEALEQPRPIKQFYPSQQDNHLFDAAHLQAYKEFLDQEVRQPTISFLDLKKQYGKHIRDEHGKISKKDGGFFGLLGITNALKFRKYLKEYVGLPLESVRESHLFPVYQGIWYAPDSHHYVAGVKETSREDQEHGHALRRIVVHQGKREPGELHEQLAEKFFPLLEVNFIRYRNYTVMPFPFRLIEMWQQITGLSSGYNKSKLTKTAYLAFNQCPKAFWLHQNQSSLAAPPDPASERRLRVGQEVDKLAQEQFPDGILIPYSPGSEDMVSLTTQAIAEGAQTLFQATFAADDLLIRADILTKTEAGWHLIEVKSSTKAKSEHTPDAAFQVYVLQQVGMTVTQVSIMHLNSACRHPDLTNLFAYTDITDALNLLPKIETDVSAMRQLTSENAAPGKGIGFHCTRPFICSFYDYCWQQVDGPTIYDIPRLSEKKAQPLQDTGILYLADIPANYALTATQRTFVDSTVQEQVAIDRTTIQQALAELEYPLYFIDFETIDYAIPKFDGCKPYQQVPFQYSCHILDADGTLTHYDYLHMDEDDPRLPLTESLLGHIGATGSLIVYNISFEKRVLRGLAAHLPEYADRLLDMANRLWDQMPIFRKHYRDYRFGKSNSLKSVLPVVAPKLSYKALSVQDGEQAQVVWEEMIGEGDTVVKRPIAGQLRAYCHLDTLAMVEIHRVLTGL